jgi:hypothetical protein
MLEVFSKIKAPNFQMVVIERKEDLWPSFRAFLTKDRTDPRVLAAKAAGTEGASSAT